MQALILDDDPFVLSVLQRLLAHRGYNVVAYMDPVSCPVFLSDSCPCSAKPDCPDVIMVDFEMPTVNGVQFVKKLKQKGCRCRNVAIMSGSWTSETLKQASRLGVSIIAKPFHFEKLESWLGAAESSSAGPSAL
jgi:CheY-like chemotaxis protein